jgi:HSP20 family molecular chaperone IbpA
MTGNQGKIDIFRKQPIWLLAEVVASSSLPRQFEAGWQPAADVYRCQHGWLVKFDLAGVSSSDVQVQVRGRELVVSGVRHDGRIDDWQSTHRLEISYSRFERTIEFPEDVYQAKLGTEYRDGMFFVHLDMTNLLTEGPLNEPGS